MPNSHDNRADRPEHDDGRLDVPAQVERSWSGGGLAGEPLTVRDKVRIVTGRQARTLAAAQGRAVMELLNALAAQTVPRGDTDDEEAD
jgi:hypothetical protein